MKMRKIIAIAAAALMLISILPFSAMAADGNRADFETVAANSGYSKRTTTAGWVGENCAVLQGGSTDNNPTFKFIGSDSTVRAFCMNGKTSAVGKITSPTLTGGISKLTFNYGHAFSESKGANITFTITDASGNTTTHNLVLANSAIAKTTAYSYEWVLETPVTGDFTLVIKNNSPSNNSGNKDRFAIWNLEWESAASTGDECEHEYDDCEDADCNKNCGHTRIAPGHAYPYCDSTECANNCGDTRDAGEHAYTSDYDATCNTCGKSREITLPTTPEDIVDAAYTLGDGDTFGVSVTLTGVITEIDTAYNDQYSNITVNMAVIDSEGNAISDKEIQCFRLQGTGADTLVVGNTIVVTGIIKNYKGTIEFDAGCTLDEIIVICEHTYEFECSTTCSLCDLELRPEAVCVNDNYACTDGLCIYCGGDVDGLGHDFDDEYDPDCNYGCGYTREVEERPAISEYTISFATTTDRVSQDGNKQVWQNGSLTFTNNKAASTNAIIDSFNPVRLYANSEIVIECFGMTEIVFDCNSGSYATALKDSIGDTASVTVESDKVTVTFDEPVDSFTIAKLTAQVRMDGITVTAVRKGDADCAHEWTDATCTDPATCTLCGAVDGNALGHKYVEDIIDSTCTATGTATYECSVCFDSYDVTIAKKLHNFVDGICSGCNAELPMEATITFGENKDQRNAFGNESQTWSNDGLVLVNNKANYNQNLGDFSNPIRMYKGTEIIISFPGMTSLVIDGPAAADYAWDDTLAGYTFTKADGVYTITFAEPTDSITLNAANQVRANTITASRVVPCAHEYFNACEQYCMICGELTNPDAAHNIVHVEAVAPTCTTMGNIEYWYCDVCGAAWLDEACTRNTNQMAVILPMAEHEYDDEYDAVCNVCGDVRDVPERPVEDVFYGDADGDGEITNLDAVMLDQYIAGWEVEGLNLANADVDGDGEITNLDAVMLDQYIAGWDVVLGPQGEEEKKQFNDGQLSEWPEN